MSLKICEIELSFESYFEELAESRTVFPFSEKKRMREEARKALEPLDIFSPKEAAKLQKGPSEKAAPPNSDSRREPDGEEFLWR